MMIKHYIWNDSWAVGKTGEKMKKPMDQTKIKTQNVWDSVKTVHKGKFICINADIKNSEHMLCNPIYLGNSDRRIMV
jgi:hypothetical protein